MYSRVTLLEIDTMRVDVDEAVAVFRESVLPSLREQDGYEGVMVLTTPDGKGMIVSVWDTDDSARQAAGFAGAALAQNMTMFKAPPGREQYEVALFDMPSVSMA